MWASLAVALISNAFSVSATFFLTRRHLRRQELRDRIKQIEEQISSLLDLAHGYWSHPHNPDTDKAFEALIKAQSQKIGTEITRLIHRDPKFRACFTPLKTLRQQITSSPFEAHNRVAQPERIMRMQEAAEDLITSIRSAAGIV